MQILLISDIHANLPALHAIEEFFDLNRFDLIINCGDSLVYGPFPNETIKWLQSKRSISILGNTDKKIIKLVEGDDFKKPSNPEKRVMYTWTAEQLQSDCCSYLQSLKKKMTVTVPELQTDGEQQRVIGIFHGSPARNHEFLFDTTPDSRFIELAESFPDYDIVVCGHSHSPFHKHIEDTHFINPGSVGRMFDGDPRVSCATLEITSSEIIVDHHRFGYDIDAIISALQKHSLPEIYCVMYKKGKKLN